MNISSIEFIDSQGETKTLKDFSGKAFLIVNTASKCGLTPQYEELQKLYNEYKSEGLQILGFPANEFLGQEPGTDEEIQSFCKLNYEIEFPINQKIVVKGDGRHPLYKALTEGKKESVKNTNNEFEKKLEDNGLLTGKKHDIHWNFEKFLVDAGGNIVERYFPDVTPLDDRVVSKIKELLEK